MAQDNAEDGAVTNRETTLIEEIEQLEAAIQTLKLHLSFAQKALRAKNKMLNAYSKREPNDPFTRSQRRVLVMVAQGYFNEQIAQTLSLSERTVRTHISHIINVLGVKNRVHVARHAWSNGLISIDEAWETVKSMQWRDNGAPVVVLPQVQTHTELDLHVLSNGHRP